MKKEEATLVGALLLCAFCGGLIGSFIQSVIDKHSKGVDDEQEA